MEIKIKRSGLLIRDSLVPMISGTMHYFRVEREKWEPILDLIKEMGFSMVETYIPWSVHELEREKFDFGERNRNLALSEFIAACKERDLWLIVRPGPHINAELTLFGYPERVLRRKECLSVSVDGDPVWMPPPPKMWPAPSYAAEAFYEEVFTWFKALAPLLKPHLATHGGNIIAIQVDNEFSNFFRNSPYDHDYHPEAIALWKRFLAEKRGEEYARKHAEPPRELNARAKEELPLYLDWVEFKEFYMQNALRRFRSMWEELGITGIPVFHNYPAGHDVPPNNWSELEKFLDFQGPDMYPTRKQYFAQKALVSFASGISHFPYIPEFSSGGFFWAAPISMEDQRFTTPVCFMHGIKGINFYMLVERERWYGSPITRDGRVRKDRWDLYVDFNRWLKKTRINELEKQACALLLSVRDYERLALATTLIDPAPPLAPYIVSAKTHCSEETFGFEQPIQIAQETQWYALFHGLSAAGIPFDCGNTSQPLEALSRYPMILCPTYEFLAREVQEKLVRYLEQGGLLVLGPELPELDADMKKCRVLAEALEPAGEAVAGSAQVFKCGRGHAVLVKEALPKASSRNRPESTTKLLLAIAERFNLPRPYPASDPAIETVLHKDEKTEVLFVANPTGEEKTAEIETGGKRFQDVQTGEEFSGSPASIPMPPYTVRILEVLAGS